MKLKLKETLAKLIDAFNIKSPDFSYGSIYKRGGIVTLTITGTLPQTADGSTMFTVPSGYRPNNIVDTPIFSTSGTRLGLLRINSNGTAVPIFGAMVTGAVRQTITYVGGYCLAVFSRLSAILRCSCLGVM